MFVVIEGLDGAGKSTQVALIQQYLESKGIKWEYIHFPRFTSPYYGEMIARFLRGEFGSANQVDPQLVAMLYAGDRKDAATQIREWISQGKTVIIDRYVLSNIAYQCAKIKNPQRKEELKEWILGLEYNHNDIPRPDLTLFLDVPFKFTAQSLAKERQGDDRNYLQGKQDIHEASLELQRAVRDMYINHQESNYKIINCGREQDEMKSPEEIFSQIMAQFHQTKEYDPR